MSNGTTDALAGLMGVAIMAGVASRMLGNSPRRKQKPLKKRKNSFW